MKLISGAVGLLAFWALLYAGLIGDGSTTLARLNIPFGAWMTWGVVGAALLVVFSVVVLAGASVWIELRRRHPG